MDPNCDQPSYQGCKKHHRRTTAQRILTTHKLIHHPGITIKQLEMRLGKQNKASDRLALNLVTRICDTSVVEDLTRILMADPELLSGLIQRYHNEVRRFVKHKTQTRPQTDSIMAVVPRRYQDALNKEVSEQNKKNRTIAVLLQAVLFFFQYKLPVPLVSTYSVPTSTPLPFVLVSSLCARTIKIILHGVAYTMQARESPTRWRNCENEMDIYYDHLVQCRRIYDLLMTVTTFPLVIARVVYLYLYQPPLTKL